MPRITFRSASSTWLERLPLGNGRLGAMVGVADGVTRIGVNESTAWSGALGSAARDAVDPDAAATALAAARAALDAGDPRTAERALSALQHRYAQAFLPVGELVVTTSARGGIVRTLDTTSGVHRSRIGVAPEDAASADVVQETAVSAADDVVLHTLRSPHPLEIDVVFTSPLRRRGATGVDRTAGWTLDLPADVAPGHEPAEPAVTWDLPGIVPGALAVTVAVDHDGVARDVESGRGWRISGATRLDVVVAIESTVTGVAAVPAPIEEAVARAAARAEGVGDAATALGRHRRDHTAAAEDFSLRFGATGGPEGGPDVDVAVDEIEPAKRLATLPHPGAAAAASDILGILAEYGRYLLRASSRPGGVPATLQGIWNAEMQPPWSSAFTLNINTPMNYWGAEGAAAGDAHLALLELIEGLARTGVDTARRLYGARGWVAHHNTDLWAYALPTRGDASWAQWPLGGAWLVRQFDEHRRHGGMDAATGARFAAVVSGCARFLLDVLVADGDALVTSPSTSPENRYLAPDGAVSLTRGSALDRALVRDVLEIAASVLPGIDDAVAAEARAALPRIAGPRRTADGRIAEWEGDPLEEDPQHRHVSALYPWFPGDGDADRDGFRDAVARTLDARGDDSTGWSLAWKIALRARLRDADAVARLLDLVLRPAEGGTGHRGGLYPNLFAAHPPFQIDGNLGLLGALLECVVQSHRPGRIDLLPAAPAALADGTLHGAVVRPGLRLDLAWSAGRPVRLSLQARTADTAGSYLVVHDGAAVRLDVEHERATVLDAAGCAAAFGAPDTSLPTPVIRNRSTT